MTIPAAVRRSQIYCPECHQDIKGRLDGVAEHAYVVCDRCGAIGRHEAGIMRFLRTDEWLALVNAPGSPLLDLMEEHGRVMEAVTRPPNPETAST